MTKFTKEAIVNSFMKLLNQKSFDAITVKDIVDDCGINRNTFYYNFDDIYALVDEILQTEINKIAGEYIPYSSWTQGLLHTCSFALENKKAIIHLHNSTRCQLVEKYLERVIYNVVIQFVEKQSENINISEEDIRFIAAFYTFALVGLLKTWIGGGMKEDFEEVISKTGKLLDENIKQAINTMAKK